MLSALIRVIFVGEFNGTAYNLPFNAAVPFDVQTISGWLLTWCFELNESLSYEMQIITTTIYFACFCNYIIAVCMHLDQLLDSVEFHSRQMQVEQIAQNRHRLRQTVKIKLQRAVETHVDIHE